MSGKILLSSSQIKCVILESEIVMGLFLKFFTSFGIERFEKIGDQNLAIGFFPFSHGTHHYQYFSCFFACLFKKIEPSLCHDLSQTLQLESLLLL